VPTHVAPPFATAHFVEKELKTSAMETDSVTLLQETLFRDLTDLARRTDASQAHGHRIDVAAAAAEAADIDYFNQRALCYGRDGDVDNDGADDNIALLGDRGNTMHLDGIGIYYADPIGEALVTGEPFGEDNEKGVFTTIFKVLSAGLFNVIAGLSTGEIYNEERLVAVAVPVIDFDTKLKTGEIGFIPTANQVADFLTVAEDRKHFVRNRTVALGGM
jgi:hypothetical protein